LAYLSNCVHDIRKRREEMVGQIPIWESFFPVTFFFYRILKRSKSEKIILFWSLDLNTNHS
jgi:hypothetical protein